MGAKYMLMGYHSRINENGERTRFKPGDIIEATEFELVQFKNKFKAVPQEKVVEVKEPEAVDYSELDAAIDVSKLYLDNADKYDGELIKRLKDLTGKRPQKADAVQRLTLAINTTLEKLAKVD